MSKHAKHTDEAATMAGAAPARRAESATTAIQPAATTGATSPAVARAVSARTAAIEAFGFWALILVYMWWIEPRGPLALRAGFLIALALMPFASLLAHRDRATEIGLGFDGLGRSAIEVGAATLGGALLIGALAACTAWRPPFRLEAYLFLPGYLVWGFLQQLALQAFVHRRLRQGLGRPELAATLAALLFGSVHLPNPVLAPATALAGWIWCRLYTRNPSLWTLALSHAALAGLMLRALPAAWTHNLRIGPGYWLWH